METIIANFAVHSGRVSVRTVTLNGRQYLVAPVTMIVPGVLPGSMGPLLYPPEEVARNVDAWNGMPLTVRHPMLNGEPVSARRPDVYARYGVGYVYSAVYNGKLVAEAWVDVELATKIDPRVITALKQGRPMEVSTGLFTQNQPVPDGSVHNGRKYKFIARNYKPDHLALLPDEQGACSLKDGCGLLANTLTELSQGTLHNLTGVSPVDKAAKIAFLIANCSCWKGEKDNEILNTFDDAKLDALVSGVQTSVANAQKHQSLVTALTNGFTINGAKVTFDATTNTFKAEAVTPAPTPTPAPSANPAIKPIEFKVIGQPDQTNNTRTESFTELLARTGTDEEKATWNMVVEQGQKEKVKIIEKLTAAVPEAQKAQAVAVYNSMKIEDLRKLDAATPAPVQKTNVYPLPGVLPTTVTNTPTKERVPLFQPVSEFANPLAKK